MSVAMRTNDGIGRLRTRPRQRLSEALGGLLSHHDALRERVLFKSRLYRGGPKYNAVQRKSHLERSESNRVAKSDLGSTDAYFATKN